MEEKRFYRSYSNQVVGGVAAGIADYTNSDPILWRVLFVLGTMVGGGLIVYLILWMVLPLEDDYKYKIKENMENQETNTTMKNEKHDEQRRNKSEGNLWGGIILIVLGSIFLVDRFVPRIDFGDLWPLILIAVGAILLFKSVPQKK